MPIPWGPIASVAGNIAGGVASWMGGKSANDLTEKAMKNGIQWKVADARKAGISPLVALGSAPFSPALVNTGEGVGSALANMGQDVSRAVVSNQSRSSQLDSLTLTNAELQNDLLRAQIARTQLEALQKPAGPQQLPAPIVLGGYQGQGASQKAEDDFGGGIGEGVGILNAVDSWVKANADKNTMLRWVNEMGAAPSSWWGTSEKATGRRGGR